jgi:DNA polymerase type B, organellar and viral
MPSFTSFARAKAGVGEAMNLIAKLLLNSLYEKFGMKSETTKLEILDNNKETLNKYLDKFNTNIVDIIYLENYTVLIYKTNKLVPENVKGLFHNDEVSHDIEVNVAVGLAITAYAKIHNVLL